MAREHTQRANTYHECGRCGVTRPLGRMRWQNGVIVCYQGGCKDKAIVGSRDLAVVRAVRVNRHELNPDEKLTHPADRRSDMYEVLY